MSILIKKFLNLHKQHLFKSNKTFKSLALLTACAGTTSVVVVNNVDHNKVASYFWAGFRFLRSLKIGMLISFDYYFSTMGLNEKLGNYKPMMSLIHKRSAERILDGCLINGGTYIKLGQGLVSLSHILPIEYIETLSVLQDKCLNRNPSELFQIIEKDFGKNPYEMFNWIDCKPIAAASLAQVFKGETINGERVAIKVQYMDLQNRFKGDVGTIDFLLKIIGVIHPDFNFGWVLTDLSSSLEEELDFLNEGRNSERCAADMKQYQFIYVPKVYWDLSSSRFLVTEFIDAIKVNDVDKLKREGFSLADIDLKISQAFAHQIFRTGFVHADPHPGNYHGLYQEIEDSTRVALSGMWKATVLHDHKEMEYYANILGVEKYEVLAEILTQRPVKIKEFKLTTRITEEQMEYMTEAARNRFDEIMQVLKVMPRSLLLVVRNLNTIRSITHDHGDPIDRYAVMARCASNVTTHTSQNFVQKLRTLQTKLHFEFKILTGRIWVWCIKTYLRILEMLGRAPNTTILVADLS